MNCFFISLKLLSFASSASDFDISLSFKFVVNIILNYTSFGFGNPFNLVKSNKSWSRSNAWCMLTLSKMIEKHLNELLLISSFLKIKAAFVGVTNIILLILLILYLSFSSWSTWLALLSSLGFLFDICTTLFISFLISPSSPSN